MAIVETHNLTKRYGGQVAVSDLTFTIEKGEIFGFLGPLEKLAEEKLGVDDKEISLDDVYMRYFQEGSP